MNFTPPPELFWKRFLPTPGAISAAEACAISWLASQVPKDGSFCDIGSHYGKSSMAAANSLPKGSLIMCDPVYDQHNLESWKNSVQQHPSNNPWPYTTTPEFKDKVRDNIKIVSAMNVKADLWGLHSLKALNEINNIAWCFVDSDTHQGGLLEKEVKLIDDKIIQGGIIAFHDYNSQFKEVKEAHEYLLSTGKFDNMDIPWAEIIEYVRQGNYEMGNESWHHKETPFPCFVGAVKRK